MNSGRIPLQGGARRSLRGAGQIQREAAEQPRKLLHRLGLAAPRRAREHRARPGCHGLHSKHEAARRACVRDEPAARADELESVGEHVPCGLCERCLVVLAPREALLALPLELLGLPHLAAHELRNGVALRGVHDQQRRQLAPLARGDTRVVQALTKPQPHSLHRGRDRRELLAARQEQAAEAGQPKLPGAGNVSPQRWQRTRLAAQEARQQCPFRRGVFCADVPSAPACQSLGGRLDLVWPRVHERTCMPRTHICVWYACRKGPTSPAWS
jgi:hypothetical protein